MVPMAEIPKTLKKLREARFFLAKMTKDSRSTKLAGEDFDFYLSAFLSAGRSVTLVLQVEQQDLYDAQYGPWENRLTPQDQALMKFMNGQRVAEVHLLGADVETTVEMVPITQIEMEPGTDPRYSISWWGRTRRERNGSTIKSSCSVVGRCWLQSTDDSYDKRHLKQASRLAENRRLRIDPDNATVCIQCAFPLK